MFCEKCGKEVKDNWKKCPYCGQTIVENSEKTGTHSKEEHQVNNSFGKIPKKKSKIKKVLLGFSVLLTVLIVFACINLSGGKDNDNKESGKEVSEEIKTLEEVGGFAQWKEDGFPGSVRADISIDFPLVNTDKNNYAVYIGAGGINIGVIMQEDEKPLKEWEWLMEAEPYEETGKAYFNGIIKYLGLSDGDNELPVFLISDVSEGDYQEENIVLDEQIDNVDSETITLPITVVNNTGIDIYGFYASLADVDNWEEDILDDQILYAGESFLINFSFSLDQLVWDFAIEDVYSETLEFYGMDFSECSMDGAVLTLYDDGTASLE